MSTVLQISVEEGYPMKVAKEDLPTYPTEVSAMYPTEEPATYPTEEPATYPTEEPAMYPTEEQETSPHKVREAIVISRHHTDPSVDEAKQRELAKARAHYKSLRATYKNRVNAMVPEEMSGASVPSLHELSTQKKKLMEDIRHHKDEQDALALDMEGIDGVVQLYEVAARVHRYEHFSRRAHDYANNELARDVQNVMDADKHQTEEEIAAYINELQSKRGNTLERVNNMQKRNATSTKPNASEEVEDDEETQKTVEHTKEMANNGVTAAEKVKRFRTLKTKLQTELVKQDHDDKKMLQTLQARIKNAELANARDARVCKELNTSNAALTANAQVLMNQVNIEHYGIDNAPTANMLIESRKQRAITPDGTPRDGACKPSGGDHAASTGTPQHASGVPSRRQSLSKPPIVAMKPTASQKCRAEAIRNEREELSVSRRRGEMGSYQSSRRQSLSKPPLVASKPTASQQSRAASIRADNDLSISRNRSRCMSINSEHPSSAAAKSNASHASRRTSNRG